MSEVSNKEDPVSETTNPAHARRLWRMNSLRPSVHSCAWTEPMLEALGRPGAEERRWHSLIDKVRKPEVIAAACTKVLANKGAPGVDHVTVAQYRDVCEHHNAELVRQLEEGSYRASELRRKDIPKAGSKELRPLGIPTVQDRIVQKAVAMVIEPIFEMEFSNRSYGFRPGLGCKDALREVDAWIQHGHRFVVDADIKAYFNNIPHGKLMQLVSKRIADGKMLELIRQFLEKGVLEEMENRRDHCGTPQGGVISPLLANIYLDPLDHLLAAAGLRCIRYADDFVILCPSREEAERGLELVRQWMAEAELELHPQKTRIADLNEIGGPFEFRGYRFQQCKTRIKRWPRRKSWDKLMEALARHTPKNSGKSWDEIIRRVNATFKGWYEYFKHSAAATLERVDGRARRRMRSILRARSGRKGSSKRGADHQRWPNKFFRSLGYRSLADAHALELQSLRGHTR